MVIMFCLICVSIRTSFSTAIALRCHAYAGLLYCAFSYTLLCPSNIFDTDCRLILDVFCFVFFVMATNHFSLNLCIYWHWAKSKKKGKNLHLFTSNCYFVSVFYRNSRTESLCKYHCSRSTRELLKVNIWKGPGIIKNINLM